MKLIFDDSFNIELKEYLLTQEGIKEVAINEKNFISEITIKFNEKTNPNIILKHIKLFQDIKESKLLEFDKDSAEKVKKTKYLIEDMCCEYCYKYLVEKLFDNNAIKSLKSNFDFNKPAFNIELIIEYNKNYKEKELIKYIKENL